MINSTKASYKALEIKFRNLIVKEPKKCWNKKGRENWNLRELHNKVYNLFSPSKVKPS